MVAAYVSSSHNTYGGSARTSLTMTAPAGATAGDLAIVVLQLESGIQTITKPTGWTIEASVAQGSTISIQVLWKRLTGSEGSSDWAFSWPSSAWSTGDAVLVRGGAATGNPFGGTLGTASGSGTTTRSSVAYTTSGAGLGFWIHSNFSDSAGITIPSGYTASATHGDHDFRFSTRADAAGSKTTGTASGGGTVAYVLAAGAILDTEPTTDPGYGYLLISGTTDRLIISGTTDKLLLSTDELPPTGPTQDVTAGSIASGEAFGSPTATPVSNVSPTAIASAQAMGSPVVATVLGVSPSGVGTSLAFGTPTIGTVLSVSPLGVVTAEALGSPAVSIYLVTTPQSIATAAVLGQPTVTTVVTVQPPGIASSVGLGSPTLSSALAVGPVAVPTGEVFGSPAAQSILQTAPVGTATSIAFGAPVVSSALNVVPKSISGPEHAPLRIESGGTYNGGYAGSTDPSVAAVTIATPQPVTITNMTIHHAGIGVWAPWGTGQATITNNHITAIPPPNGGNPEQQGVNSWEPHTLIVENNTFTNAHGVQVSGGGYVSTTVRIDRNSFTNIGRWSQPSIYQGAVHLDNVQCPGMKVRWNKIFNERGKSHSEDTIACSNGTSGASGNEIEVAYNIINGTYPISGDGASFTGGAYDFGDISGGYIIAHHNYALNYTNNGFMIPSGHDIKIHDCVAVYDGLADDGQRTVSTWGWGFTVANLYGGGVTPNSYLQDNRSAHRRWNGASWETANFQWNAANNGDQDLGGNTILGVGSQTLEDNAAAEWEALRVSNAINIGATGSPLSPGMGNPTVSTVVLVSPSGIVSLLAVGNPSILGMNTAAPAGIASGLVFGVPIATVTTNAQPVGISSAMVMGNPVVSSVLNVVAQAIASALAMGVPSISVGLTVAPVGIATAQALGVPVLGTVLLVQPTGVESAVVLGEPRAGVNIDASPIGVESLLAFGLPMLNSVLGVEILGISSAEVFGQPVIAITAESQGLPGARNPVTSFVGMRSYTQLRGDGGAFIKPHNNTAWRNNGDDGAWITQA